MAFYVYILASRRNGTFYIGMADNPILNGWVLAFAGTNG
jgi:hypothetical protein